MQSQVEISPILEKYKPKIFKKGNGQAESIVLESLKASNNDNPKLILDLAAVIDQFKLWQQHLPRVQIFYAVKATYEPFIMDILAHLGCGFDVASKYEFEVTDKYKFQSEKFIYSNPNKQISHLLNAKERGIDLTVIDSLGELEKIRVHFPEARMLIRLKTDGKGTTFNFSVRFGVTLEEAEKILIKAKEYGLKIVGTSFHVGYRSSSPESYYNSIQQSLRVFEKGTSLGFKMEIIDIGGGYPGFEWDTEKGFEELAKGINKGIDESLVQFPNARFLSEPGRFFCARTGILAAQIIGKKPSNSNDGLVWLYTINEGRYGFFNGILPDEPNIQIRHFKKGGSLFKSRFYGPCCDSSDIAVKEIEIEELEVGDWIYFANCGAYAKTCAGAFNGFGDREDIFIWREDSLDGDSHNPNPKDRQQ